MAERVIVNSEGSIQRLELKPTFHYPTQLKRLKYGGENPGKSETNPIVSGEQSSSIYVRQSGR